MTFFLRVLAFAFVFVAGAVFAKLTDGGGWRINVIKFGQALKPDTIWACYVDNDSLFGLMYCADIGTATSKVQEQAGESL